MSQRWRNLQELIDCGGEVSAGNDLQVGGVARATMERDVYAMLRIGDGELLPDVLDRLDAAVSKAIEAEMFTDEINR